MAIRGTGRSLASRAPVTRGAMISILAFGLVFLSIVGVALARPVTGSALSAPPGWAAPQTVRFAKPKTVAFIGDSYTAGAAGVPGSQLWPELLSKARGWNSTNLALGGTGYVTGFDGGGQLGCGKSACGNYLEMVPEAVAASPDVVIVSGGRNDLGKPLPEILKNIQAVFTELRKGLPDAKIVALSPLLGADDTPSSFPSIKPAVKAAVESVGGVYVDLGAPLGGHPELIWKDGVHPTAGGQKVLADATNRLMPGLSEAQN